MVNNEIVKELIDKKACDVVDVALSMNINEMFCKNSEQELVDVLVSAKLEDMELQKEILESFYFGKSINNINYNNTYKVGSNEVPYGYMIFKCVNDAIQYCNCYRDLVGKLITFLFVPRSDQNSIRYFENLVDAVRRRTSPIIVPTNVMTLIDYIDNSPILKYVHEFCNTYKHSKYIEFDLKYDLLSNEMTREIKEFKYKNQPMNTKKDVLAVLNDISTAINEINKQVLLCIKNDYTTISNRLHIYDAPLRLQKDDDVFGANPVISSSLVNGNTYEVAYGSYEGNSVRIFSWEYDIILVVSASGKCDTPIGYLKRKTPEKNYGCYYEFEYHDNITDTEISNLLNGISKQKTYVF